VADLANVDVLRTTLKEKFGSINSAKLRRELGPMENYQTIGKVVFAGFRSTAGA
jgi:hypothetical protein